MAQLPPAWTERERRRFMRPNAHLYMRPNAHLYIRHDAYRYMAPGAPRHIGKDVVRYFWPDLKPAQPVQRNDCDEDEERQRLAVAQQSLDEVRHALADLKFWLRFRQLLRKAGFNPDQPRVPAGTPDGGQWTSDGGSEGVREAANEKLPIGPRGIARILAEVAKRAIEAFRSENGLWDLFKSRIGTVAVTSIDGENVFGSNSTSPTYTSADRAAAEDMRGVLLEKYPEVMSVDNIGGRPNDALFHAEANVLMRAAKANGGTLAGREIEVHADREMCQSCQNVLPLLGLELGNPTVTFVGPRGTQATMRNGEWIK